MTTIKPDYSTLSLVIHQYDVSDETDRIKILRKFPQTMTETYKGEELEAIAIVPEQLTLDYFLSLNSVQQVLQKPSTLTVGLDLESVEPVVIHLEAGHVCVGAPKNAIQDIVGNIVEIYSKEKDLIIIDNKRKYLNDLKEMCCYCTESEEIVNVFKEIFYNIQERQKSSSSIDLKIKDKVVIINDIDILADAFNDDTKIEQTIQMIKDGSMYNTYFIILSELESFMTSRNGFRKIVSKPAYAIVTAKINDTSLDVSQRMYNEKDLNRNEANFVYASKCIRFKYMER